MPPLAALAAATVVNSRTYGCTLKLQDAHPGAHTDSRGRLSAARMPLPAHSTLTVWIQFEKRLLHIDAQPSDASRGVDVPAAALRYRPAGASAAEVRELYAEGGVMPIPLADRSMPYNVVMLTSTVVALFVGSMHNLLARPPALQVTAAGPPA